MFMPLTVLMPIPPFFLAFVTTFHLTKWHLSWFPLLPFWEESRLHGIVQDGTEGRFSLELQARKIEMFHFPSLQPTIDFLNHGHVEVVFNPALNRRDPQISPENLCLFDPPAFSVIMMTSFGLTLFEKKNL